MYNKDSFKYKRGYKKDYLYNNWEKVGFRLKKKENIKNILKNINGEITKQEFNLLNSFLKNKNRLLIDGGMWRSYFKIF